MLGSQKNSGWVSFAQDVRQSSLAEPTVLFGCYEKRKRFEVHPTCYFWLLYILPPMVLEAIYRKLLKYHRSCYLIRNGNVSFGEDRTVVHLHVRV